MATQNPIEYEGTYPLPEAQIDRFLIRTAVGYPTAEEEALILLRRKTRGKEEAEVQKVIGADEVLAMQKAVEAVHVEDIVNEYIVAIVAATRGHPQVEVGASPRGTLAVMKLASAQAAVQGRDFVLPDDIKSVAVAALSHRLVLAADTWVRGVRPEAVMDAILKKIPVPKVV
jgi:MoxR-like ATPase